MQRETALDIARTLSMLYIVGVWHLSNYTNVFDVGPFGVYIKNATLGLFMFLSGYLLGSKYIIRNLDSWLIFVRKRVLRIIPLLILAISFYVIKGSMPIKQALLAITGLSTFIPPQPSTLWFVSMVIIFYMLYPLFVGRRLVYQIIVFVVLFAVLYFVKTNGMKMDRRFFYYFPCFIFGIILASKNLKKYGENWKILFCSLFAFILSIYFIKYVHIALSIYLLRAIIATSGLFIVLFISYKFSACKFVVFIATHIAYASMGAYLFHRQILSVIRSYIYWPEDGYLRLFYLVFICLPLIMFTGYYIQFFYDKLLIKLSKKINDFIYRK
jgi:hypothetical protein